MSKTKSNNKLEERMEGLERASEQILSGRGYIKENKSIAELEKNLKKELIKKNEVTASSVFLNRVTQKFS